MEFVDERLNDYSGKSNVGIMISNSDITIRAHCFSAIVNSDEELLFGIFGGSDSSIRGVRSSLSQRSRNFYIGKREYSEQSQQWFSNQQYAMKNPKSPVFNYGETDNGKN